MHHMYLAGLYVT